VLIKAFSRVPRGASWFGRSEHDKQNNEPFLTERFDITIKDVYEFPKLQISLYHGKFNILVSNIYIIF
jgi:hypothetical protein